MTAAASARASPNGTAAKAGATAFVLDTVTSKAKRVIEQHQDLVLSNDVFDRFIAALDKPAKQVPELVELSKNYPRLREV